MATYYKPDNFSGSATGVETHTKEQDSIKAQMNANSQAWHDAPSGNVNTPGTKEWLHDQNMQLAAKLGGNVSTSFDSASGTWGGSAAKPAVQQPVYSTPTVSSAPNLSGYLDSWLTAAQEQQKAAIDYGTGAAVNDIVRAQKDAEAQFQEQRNQIAIDEAKAKDNQALYNERRGDKGGIGGEQYDAIMNQAAQNRQAVNSAQAKLSTDTARQIADLRAQGEYQKADALLQLGQQYLSQLISLEQWAAEYNMSAAQFNASLQQWQQEFALQVGQVTGNYMGTPTLGALQFQNDLVQNQQSRLANAGEALLAAGIMPSASQLEAMNMTADQAQRYIAAAKLAAVTGDTPKKAMSLSVAKEQAEAGIFDEDILAVLRENGYSDAAIEALYGYNPKAENAVNDPTKLSYDEDEGIFTWNGKTYKDAAALLKDIEAAELTNEQLETLKKKFSAFGFDLG